MGQIITTDHAIPKRANLVAIQTGSLANYVPDEGEIILVSKGNEMELNGDGVFNYYIKGDGVTKASELELIDYAFVHGVKDGKYLYSICDKDGYVICGITKEGKFFIGESLTFGNADIREVDNENKDTLFHILDGNGNMLMKINRQGVPVVPKGMIWDGHESGIKLTETDQWLLMFTDSNDKIIAGIDKDGALHQNAIEGLVSAKRVNNDKYLIYFLDKKDNLVFGIDKNGQAVFPYSPILSTIKFTSNKEFCYSIISQNGYILWGIRGDGSVYQPKGIPTEARETLNKHEDRISDLERIINNATFKTKIDWSDSPDLQIPEPRYMIMNIISSFNLSNLSKPGRAGAIAGYNYDVPTEVEVWDMQGDYFKKWTLMSAQGNSSMVFIKKNIALDFFNENPHSENFNEDNTFKIRIGDWVVQDSYHMKAYYTDFFRGVGSCAYELYEQIVKTRGNKDDRPWKKMLIDMNAITTTTKSFDNPIQDDYELQYDTGARCFPAGLPVVIFQNGDFYGLYCWQIKKHRDNYHMSKSNVKHIHLDGDLRQPYIWNGRNNIRWIGFEVRNPKKLVYNEVHDGTFKYDADVPGQFEIAGTNGANYKGTWSASYNEGNGYEQNAIVVWVDENSKTHQFINSIEGNKAEPTINFKKGYNIDKDPDFKNKTKCGWINCTNTCKVKNSIMNLSDYMATLRSLNSTYDADKTAENKAAVRAQFEQWFDPQNLIDYMIVSDLIKNSDGFAKNWQWITYDGIKWFVGLYDVDMSFGGHFQGNQITPCLTGHMNTNLSLPNGYVIKYYWDEMKARYAYLADNKIITSDNIFKIVYDWTQRLGEPFYAKEWVKWPNSPCIGESTVRTSYWELQLDNYGHPICYTSIRDYPEFIPTRVKLDGEGQPIYIDETHTVAYEPDEEVLFGLNSTMGFYLFKCVQTVPTVEGAQTRTTSAYSPISYFRHTDSIYRIQNWIEQEVINMNSVYEYTPNP